MQTAASVSQAQGVCALLSLASYTNRATRHLTVCVRTSARTRSTVVIVYCKQLCLSYGDVHDAYSEKSLGIHLDRGLSWNVHIGSVSTELASGIFVLRSSAKYCPIQVVKRTLYGLVLPSHFLRLQSSMFPTAWMPGVSANSISESIQATKVSDKNNRENYLQGVLSTRIFKKLQQ